MSDRLFTDEERRLLRAALLQVPTEVHGSHLTEEQLDAYAWETLDGDTLGALDRHLQSCAYCCAMADETLARVTTVIGVPARDIESVAIAPASTGEAKVAVLSAVRWLKSRQVPYLRPDVHLMAAGSAVVDAVESERGVFLKGTLNSDFGDLRLTVGSTRAEMEGALVTLKDGGSLRLANVGAGEYTGEVLVLAEEWARMGPGNPIREIQLADGTVVGEETD